MSNSGTLTLVYGPMFSGKTTWLIEHFRPGDVAFRPMIDTRYTTESVLHNHNGKQLPALSVDSNQPKSMIRMVKEARPNLARVMIDEIHFYPNGVVGVIREFLAGGLRVIVAGLLTDSERSDFGVTRVLLEMADEVHELTARCDGDGCQSPARWSYAKAKKTAQLVVGAGDLYGAACEKHYELLHVIA
jgi:thymidine kinase